MPYLTFLFLAPRFATLRIFLTTFPLTLTSIFLLYGKRNFIFTSDALTRRPISLTAANLLLSKLILGLRFGTALVLAIFV